MTPIMIKKPTGMKFYWNIDANVGANSPNQTDDVQLIQFGYSIMANVQSLPADERAAFAQVKVGAPCTGKEDDPLVRAIRAHQKGRGGTQDGHVSVIHTSNGVYIDATGAHSFMLIAIVNNIFDATKNDFPRIDKHPRCPAAVKTSVIRACTL